MRSPSFAFRKNHVVSLAPLALAAALTTSVATFAQSAQAQTWETPAGRRGTLVFDDLSGFKASTVGGVGYSGPIGVSFTNYSVTTSQTAAGNTTETSHVTTFWLSPSVDVFVIDHLSVGGRVEVAIRSGNVDNTTNIGGSSNTVNSGLPTATDLTFLPRVGWLFDLNEHWGIWPRVGLGYGQVQNSTSATVGNTTVTTNNTFSGAIFEVDCPFLYRLTPGWFLRMDPDFTFWPGNQGGNSANVVNFALTGGLGYMWH
ncbi:MAG TPA: hypothetical protein VGI39_24990 [Polyangiaceae bacterium]|jgi:hypothetical protein